MGFDVAQIPQDQVDAVLSKPWAADGSNFSDRIWKDKDKLQRNLQDILTQGLVRGDSIQKMAKDMAERMNVSRSNAARLIATESAYFASRGELDNMKELGVKEFEFVATLDSRTSDICRSMDGKVIPLKDFKPGTTVPPLHCYCRSCTVPHVGTVENFQKMRAARDPKTRKTVRIPDMTYQDWYDVFVAKKRTLEEWEKSQKRKAAVAAGDNIKINTSEQKQNPYSPDNQPEEHKEFAIEQIQKDTGFNKKDSEDVYDAILAYTGNRYREIIEKVTPEFAHENEIIEKYIAAAPHYEGHDVFSGLSLSKSDFKALLKSYKL